MTCSRYDWNNTGTYILHVANIFKGLKHDATNSCSVWWVSSWWFRVLQMSCDCTMSSMWTFDDELSTLTGSNVASVWLGTSVATLCKVHNSFTTWDGIMWCHVMSCDALLCAGGAGSTGGRPGVLGAGKTKSPTLSWALQTGPCSKWEKRSRGGGGKKGKKEGRGDIK